MKFVKLCYCVNWISSEYILSSCDKLTVECVQAANLVEGIEKAVMMKNLSRLLSYEIRTNNLKKPWLPTPQDILNDTFMKNTNLYNLIGWIIDPNASFSYHGFVKLSKFKSIKVMKICDDIMTLYQRYDQHLAKCYHPLIFFIKPVPVPLLMCYINWGMRFIDDKWAEWSSIQSTIIPSTA